MTAPHPESGDLVLLYYNEPGLDPALREHVVQCPSCTAALQSLSRVLNACDEYDAPVQPGTYEMQVWAKLRPRIVKPALARRWWIWSPALAAAVTVAFLGGMLVEKTRHAGPAAGNTALVSSTPRARERVLLVALGDHLDRSQIVLAELVNSKPNGTADIAREQLRAEDLVQESRLLRQTAVHSGDSGSAQILEELERVLLEIAHSPSRISSPELLHLQQRIEDQGLLFKVRIIQTNIHKKEQTL